VPAKGGTNSLQLIVRRGYIVDPNTQAQITASIGRSGRAEPGIRFAVSR
jgi:hypothetical protein